MCSEWTHFFLTFDTQQVSNLVLIQPVFSIEKKYASFQNIKLRYNPA